MRVGIVATAAGIAHAVVVVAVLLGMGHPVPGPATLAGLVLLGALPVWWWCDGVRPPLVLAALGLVTASVLEVVTPGPWVTGLGGDVVTVGTPVLWSYAVASPLWLAACGLLGLVSVRPCGWGRAALCALATTALWFAAVVATGLGRGWAASPPSTYGVVPAVVLVLGSTLLLRRFRLVAPWAVLVLVTVVAPVALWVQPPSDGADAATGLLDGSTVSLALAILLGLVEATVRGVVRLVRRPRRADAPARPVPEMASR